MFRCLRASAALLRNRLAPLDPTIPLRLWAHPSNVPEGGHGPRRRQPPAHAALQKYNSYSSNNQRNSYYFYETVAKIGFKSYNPNDNLLLPPCLGDFLPQKNPARVVSEIVERMRSNAELRS